MHAETPRIRLFGRRALVLGGIKLGLFGFLAGRLYQLQVVESDRYRMLADENRINVELLAPPRGRIVDRFGRPLAVNRQNYRALLIPERARKVEATLAAFDRLVPLSAAEREKILREAARRRAFLPIAIREDLDWADVARIEAHAPELAGIVIEVGERRHYPYGRLTAHVVGYVGQVSEKELGADPVLSLPGFRIGKSGVERVQDIPLRGRAGAREVEVNAVGRAIRELSRREGLPGDDLVLSLDIGLQGYVYRRLAEESAAAAVLDVHTGEVLALVSSPSFDPNAFTRGLDPAAWKALIQDPRKPLIDKAIAGQYPPGSTFKMMVALAALESGEIGPGHRVFCPGYLRLGNRRFYCWRRGGHGTLAMIEAIAQSCDVYFYDVARRVGVDRISAMARRFGFGQRLGLELPGEKAGLLPSRAWKRATFGEPWQQGETLAVGIGQSFVLSTPLQLAVMAARIANGGVAVRPTLIRERRQGGHTVAPARAAFSSIGVAASSLAVVAEGMRRVTNSPHGTAYRARIAEPEFAMAGKTGSAQVRRITKRERLAGVRKNEDRPWKERDHALFVGFAPVGSPRYATAVVVEHGGSGAHTAAPIARDILLETQRRDPARRTPASQEAALRRLG